jgi:ATP-binding protein involved in chromosome partitioning
MTITADQVRERLKGIKGPDGSDLVASGKLSDIVISENKVFFSLTVDANAAPAWESIRKKAETEIRSIPGVASVLIALTAERSGGAPPAGGSPMKAPPPRAGAASRSIAGVPGVEAVIAVASGKGGVGKSTTAVNLALGLRDLGMRVGVLDADIYGPSMPRLLAIKGKPETIGGRMLKPMESYGLKVMSIGFLVDEETPMIWRGPMVMTAITQMLREVQWGTLDIMVVDMPPGTGDAQLTLAQQVPLAGAVIVSTPQDLALIDARRGIAMFRRVDVPVLGLVENMSYFLCPHCGERSDPFGHGGAKAEAERQNVPFLGEVPLEIEIRETSDSGLPIVATKPDSAHAKIYREIAARVRDQMAGGGKARTAPRIVIES